MARAPRLDSPGALHHVWARGIEKRSIFYDDRDREDFLDRLGTLACDKALEVFAWALMPNHVHLVVRTLEWSLHRSMRSLLAGFATHFNRRHERVGHLFQNRYRSTLCEDEPYFIKLIQYVHLNPVPAVVPDVPTLDSYRFSGHATLVGRASTRWQNVDAVLRRFSSDESEARLLYRRLIAEGALKKTQPLCTEGLVETPEGWRRVANLQRGREHFARGERVLGSDEFVDRILRELPSSKVQRVDVCAVIDVVCHDCGTTRDAVSGSSRIAPISRARAGIAYLWTIHLGHSATELGRTLGMTVAGIHAAARRGRTDSRYWCSLLERSPFVEEVRNVPD